MSHWREPEPPKVWSDGQIRRALVIGVVIFWVSVVYVIVR